MILILPLTTINETAIQLLNGGYTSPARYRVHKDETPECTSFTLDLEPLQQPYIKTWEPTPDDLERYNQLVGMGFSFGAFAGGQLVGIGIAEERRWNLSLWIWELHVRPDYQRQGAAQWLVDALAEKASATGLRVLVAETQNTNVPAIRFYRAAGFELDGVDLSYYTNRDATDFEVALFMKKKLT